MNIRLPLAKSISYVINNSRTSRIRYAALFFLCLAVVFSSPLARRSSAQADGPAAGKTKPKDSSGTDQRALANLGLVIRIGQDGLAPMNTIGDMLNGRNVCPSDPSAGCDFSEHNSIVRTNDQVIYTYDYSVNAGDEPDVTVTAAAPFGTVWSPILPAFCFMPGSSVNAGDGDGTQSILTCRRGAKASGTAESLPFVATVLGTVLNGEVINASGQVSGGVGSPSSPAFAGAPNVTVSAAPRYNLRKEFFTYNGSDAAGYTVSYTATIGIFDDSSPAIFDPRYGSSILPGTLTFNDTVSAVSPKAAISSCTLVNSFGAPGPGISCLQPGGAGTPISVTVTNATTSLSQYTGPQSLYGIAAFRISVFISPAEITAGGHVITDTLTDFNPVSPSPANQPNFNPLGENLSDNGVSITVVDPGPPVAGPGFFRKNFVREYNNGTILNSNTFVSPTETFAAEVFFVNDTLAPLNNVILCDVIDNTKYEVIEIVSGSGNVYDFGGLTPTAVEFASGYVNPAWLPTGPGGNPAGIRAECNGPGWDANPAAVSGGITAISRFRVRFDTMSAGASISLRVRVRARDTYYPANTVSIPAGSALPNFGIWRSDEKNPLFTDNDYFPSVYPNSPTGNGNYGARVNLARALVRITKETENNNTANSIETGSPNGIGFVLKPTVTTIGSAIPVPVTVTDVLPPGMHFVVGSSSLPPPQLQPITFCTGAGVPHSACAVNGQEILTWTLIPNPTPNAPIAPITFRATADLTVLNNQTLTNTAVISSPADPEDESVRTAIRNIVGASPSTFLIYKQTSTPLIDVNGNFTYTVTYRNASFQTDFTGMDFIDVFPFVGDTTLPFGSGTHMRTPNSSFSGTRTLLTQAGPAGATWYYTDHLPASTINLSPKHLSNLNPGVGASIWCPGTASGPTAGCLTGPVTAIRMQDNTPMPRNNTIRSFTLTFSSNSNVTNDIYVNNSGGSVNEIVLPVSSINVPVVVREGKISGVVWYDTNADGIRDPLETGRVPSSLVTLTGPVSASMMTGPSGGYAFNGLPGGTYTVKFTRPINYRVSPQDQGGNDSADSDGDPVTLIATVPNLAVPAASTVDQGFYQLNLRGTVWKDTNCNGLHDTGESALTLPIFDLELLDDLGMPVRKTQTTGGDYVFVNLPAGDYKVRMTTSGIPVSPIFSPNPNDDVDRDNNGIQETDNSLISNTISLAPGTEPDIQHGFGITLNKTLDFGLCIPPTAAAVSVGGRVMTSDGSGLGKVLVTMTDSTGVVYQVLTSPFGYYRFDGVTAGRIVIINVSDKRYIFDNSPRVVTVSGDLTEVDFVPVK